MKKARGFGNREAYKYWVLRALSEADGGTATKRATCRWTYARIEKELIPYDYEPMTNGEPRWEHQIAWARKDLVGGNFLERGTPIDVWQITAAGHALLKRYPSPPKLNRDLDIEEIG